MDIHLLYWSIPIILTLHELEEWNILNWYHKYYADPPPSDTLGVRTWILFLSAAGFVWTGLSIFIDNVLTPILMCFLILVSTQNAIQHIYWQFLFKAYSPGIVFSSLGLVAGCYTIFELTKQGLLPTWIALCIPVLLIPATYETIKARNTMTPSILAVHKFGMKLAQKIWFA